MSKRPEKFLSWNRHCVAPSLRRGAPFGVAKVPPNCGNRFAFGIKRFFAAAHS
jgi:hypothetical protein